MAKKLCILIVSCCWVVNVHSASFSIDEVKDPQIYLVVSDDSHLLEPFSGQANQIVCDTKRLSKYFNEASESGSNDETAFIYPEERNWLVHEISIKEITSVSNSSEIPFRRIKVSFDRGNELVLIWSRPGTDDESKYFHDQQALPRIVAKQKIKEPAVFIFLASTHYQKAIPASLPSDEWAANLFARRPNFFTDDFKEGTPLHIKFITIEDMSEKS